MKGSNITKPLLRAATAGVATNNPRNYSPSGIPARFPPIPSPAFESRVPSSTSLIPPNSNINFLRRTFSSHSYPPPNRYARSLLPLGTLALVGGIVFFLTASTVQALNFSPFSSKPNAAARMKERLDKHGFVEKPVSPDGNCQMRALADQLFGDENRHKEVRGRIMRWLSSHEKFAVDENGGATLGDFIDRDQFPKWNSYISYMSQNGAWGDHITLLGAAETYGVTITVLSNVDDNGANQYMTYIRPRSTRSTNDLYISHWHEMHYNSLQFANPKRAQEAA